MTNLLLLLRVITNPCSKHVEKDVARLGVEAELRPVDSRPLPLLIFPQTLTTFLLTHAVIPAAPQLSSIDRSLQIQLPSLARSSSNSELAFLHLRCKLFLAPPLYSKRLKQTKMNRTRAVPINQNC
jgi:hypothetical protein